MSENPTSKNADNSRKINRLQKRVEVLEDTVKELRLQVQLLLQQQGANNNNNNNHDDSLPDVDSTDDYTVAITYEIIEEGPEEVTEEPVTSNKRQRGQ